MTNEPQNPSPIQDEEPKNRLKRFETWLLSFSWAIGAAIYGWLIAGVIYKREYPNLTWDKLGGADWWFTGVSGGLTLLVCLVYFFFRSKKGAGESGQLLRIVVAVLPALFVVSALAVLVLTLATYNEDWKEARQGLATAFTALIAAIGVVVSVAVSYRTGEENRKAQQENMREQLRSQQENLKEQLRSQQENLKEQLRSQQENLKEQLRSQQENLKEQLRSQQENLHVRLNEQRNIEDSKGKREQDKMEADTIKALNERLHEILPRRNSDDEKERISSYYQLAALYNDWVLLAKNSEKIEIQRANQQKYIRKILFGTHDDSANENYTVGVGHIRHSGEISRAKRSKQEELALNSVIGDIIPEWKGEENDKEGISESISLEFANLSLIDLSQRNLVSANLREAHLAGAILVRAHLKGAHLWLAHLEGANLFLAHLEGADLWLAHLEGAYLFLAHLEGADLREAHLAGAYLRDAHLEGALFFKPGIGEAIDQENIRGRIINQLKVAEKLPDRKELLKAKDFDQELVDEIFKAHQQYWAEKKNLRSQPNHS